VFQPNQYTLVENGVTYGLHRFKDGETMLCSRHERGDWQTICRPTDKQVKVFEKFGEKAKK
jgi:hypothetical protein